MLEIRSVTTIKLK